MTREQIEQAIDESMPDIIQALKYKIEMYEREIRTVRAYGNDSNANRLHAVNCDTELNKALNLLKKLEQ